VPSGLSVPETGRKVTPTVKTFVMIPTYNEKENIVLLIEKIRAIGIEDVQIVVVDDNSPDGTSGLVKSLMESCKDIHLILRRKNKGRGLAGLEGFKYCVQQGADYVIEMDADFSHDPAVIPQFLEKIKDYDLVIGSRFVKGAKNSRQGPLRNLITGIARSYIRIMLGLAVKDPTSGFRCFRSDALRAIDLDSTISEGPAIVQEILYKAHVHHLRIAEIPIIFEDRVRGASTFTPRLAFQGFLMVLIFRLLFSKVKKPEEVEVFRSDGENK
jgi:dolichol-phosphate mannosyltransferase